MMMCYISKTIYKPTAQIAMLYRKMCTKISAGCHAEEILNQISESFQRANVSEPGVSAQILVGEVLGTTNLDILPKVAKTSYLNTEQSESLAKMVQCRLAKMPIQYIIGYWEFRELRLTMKPPVFIPRAETEGLVDVILNHLIGLKNTEINILEIGCGSGAISLSLMKEYKSQFNNIKILAVDQSASACRLTLENAANLQLLNTSDSDANLLPGKCRNTLEVQNIKINDEFDNYGLKKNGHSNQLDVIVSNPPYVLRKDLSQLDPQITLYEDLRALDGGKDGLQVIENIIKLSNLSLKPNGYLFLEIDPCHAFLIPNLLENIYGKSSSTDYKMILRNVIHDFRGKDRFAILEKCLSSIK